MELSKRLYRVAMAVTPGKRLADIGTDHGYVPIFLVEKELIPSAIAMDINKGPLERAVDHINSQGLQGRISTRLSDGMKELKAGEADTVTIAGMGGDLMCRILSARKDLLDGGMELILQPQSEWFKVRHLLHDYGYAIEKEWFLKEDGKYYVIMKALPGQQTFVSEWQYAYGAFLEEDCWDVYEEYLKKEMNKREEISAGIRAQIEKTREDEKNLCSRERRLSELQYEISLIKERLRAGR